MKFKKGIKCIKTSFDNCLKNDLSRISHPNDDFDNDLCSVGGCGVSSHAMYPRF